VVADNKSEIKAKIKLLKGKRDEAVNGKDYKELKNIRRKIHLLKRGLHKAAV
jgi:protein-arginine kinase activator protein McsA